MNGTDGIALLLHQVIELNLVQTADASKSFLLRRTGSGKRHRPGRRSGASVVHGSGGAKALGDVGDRLLQSRMPTLLFQLNQDRRRHVPRQQHKVSNGPVSVGERRWRSLSRRSTAGSSVDAQATSAALLHGGAGGAAGWANVGRCPFLRSPGSIFPFKLNQDRRHHIPKQKHKVTNLAAYDAALRQSGSLTFWFTDEAVAAWKAEPRMTRGGQRWYSPLAILTALTLRTVFRLVLRQTEGLIGSIIHLLGLTPAAPDHSTLSRRAKTLEVPRPRSRRDGEPFTC